MLLKFAASSILLLISWLAWQFSMRSERPVVINISSELLLLVAFLALNVAATIGAPDKWIAVLGAYGHYFGLIAVSLLVLSYFLALQVDWRESRVLIFAWLIFAGATIQAVVGVAQMTGSVLGFEILTVGLKSFRSTGLMGNANGLAAMLVPTLPIGMFLHARAVGRVKLLVGLLVALMAVVALSTLSIAGWLAFIIMVVIVAFDWWKAGNRMDRGFLLAGIVVLFLIGGFFYLSTQKTFGPESILDRVFRIDKTEGSMAERVRFWKAAGRLIIKRPVLGWGPDSFRYVSPKHGKLDPMNVIPVHPHNILLEIAAAAGVPGAIVFSLFCWRWGRRFFRRKRDRAAPWGQDPRLWFGLALVSLLTISLAQQLRFPSFVLFFVIAALTSVLEGALRPVSFNWGRLPRALLGGTSILVFAASLWAGARAVDADVHYHRAIAARTGTVSSDAIARAMALNPYLPTYRYFAVNKAIERLERDHSFAYAAGLLRSAHRRWPEDPIFYMLEARLYERRGLASDLDRAKDAAIEAVKLFPRSYRAFGILGDISLLREEYREAADYYARAALLKPRSFYFHVQLAEARQKAGDPEGAVNSYEAALRIKSNSPDVLAKKYVIQARALIGSGGEENEREALQVANKALAIQPDSYSVHLIMGGIMLRMLNYREAVGHFQRAAATRPNSFEAWLGLCEAFRGIGDRQGALDAYVRAARLGQGSNAELIDMERWLSEG